MEPLQGLYKCNEPPHTHVQISVLFCCCCCFFILNWGWETSQNCHPLHVFSPLPLSPPRSPPVLREKLHPAHMFFIRAQLRLTCHTSTRWTLPGFDILCVSHTWLTLHGFDQLSPLLNTSPELISQPGSEREWEKGCGLSFSVVTHWNFFFFFWLRVLCKCVSLWLQGATGVKRIFLCFIPNKSASLWLLQ